MHLGMFIWGCVNSFVLVCGSSLSFAVWHGQERIVSRLCEERCMEMKFCIHTKLIQSFFLPPPLQSSDALTLSKEHQGDPSSTALVDS